jgi:hypothetical protein
MIKVTLLISIQISARMLSFVIRPFNCGYVSSSFLMSSLGSSQITEGLVPALQRRGLVRTEYTQSHLRDTLREF